MLEILKQIQSDVSDIKVRLDKVEERLGNLEVRADKVEDLVKRERRDTAALLVMMKGTVGVFNERMDALDIRLVTLEEGH